MRREQHTSSAADPTPRSRGAEVGCIPTMVQILFYLRQQAPARCSGTSYDNKAFRLVDNGVLMCDTQIRW